MDKNQSENLLTGIFTVSGVVLLLVLLFFLGLSDCFSQKVTLHTGFSESVQGLSRGSAVKYRGVQIGTVSDIVILVKQNIIRVDMEVEPKYFAAGRKKSYSYQNFKNFMMSEISKKGLRARLEMLGITGMKYIDLDYFAKPDSKLPPAPPFSSSDMLYVPSVTSQMKDITGTLTMAIDRISRIRFEKISDQLETALTGLGQLLNSNEIRSTIARINETAENLETSTNAISTVLSEARLKNLAEQLERNMKALDNLQKVLLAIADASKIPDTTASFREALSSISSNKEEFTNSLIKLNQMLESIRVLADSLTDNPASLIRGKKTTSQDDKK
ncbi:MAG: MCE family protein [Lentisphaeria bacterium]|nr:MCE family protein [Lentisphaeria bacterium]